MKRRTLLAGLVCIGVSRSAWPISSRIAEAQDLEGNTFSLTSINGSNHFSISTKTGTVVVAELGIRMFKAFKSRFKDAKKKAMSLESNQVDVCQGISNITFSAMGMGAMGCAVVVKMSDGKDKAQFVVTCKGKDSDKFFSHYNVDQFEAVLNRVK